MADPEPPKTAQENPAEVGEKTSEAVILTEPTMEEPEPPKSVDPESATIASPPPQRPRRSGAAVGFVAGGVIAAALGFGLARFAVPDGWPLAATAPLQARLAEQAEQLTALRSDMARLEASLAAPAADPRVAELEMALAETRTALAALVPAETALAPQFAALETRLRDLEKRPTADGGVSAAALAAFERDLEALRTEVEAQRAAGVALATDAAAAAEAAQARLAEAEAKAQAMARDAAVTAALGHLRAAIESGAPYGDVLTDLEAAGQDLPAALREGAQAGVSSLSALQAAFPAAARAALEASIRVGMGDTWTDRVTALLRSQTGVRSLTPREGADPDAVLSRAEAALREGDLAGAVAEVQALPPEGQAAMADWRLLAERRLAATDALAAFTAAATKQ
ncbi:MAG: hypothetical protein Q8P60_16285 [Pseudorhodobacter sp.]|nr:hypothetical protein [Pseudorhodobacter sp.]